MADYRLVVSTYVKRFSSTGLASKFHPVAGPNDTLRYGLRALTTLRRLNPSSLMDLSTVFALSLAIITYSNQLVGYGTQPIVEAALQSVGLWLGSCIDSHWVAADSNLVCVVFYDTIDCLLRRKRPIVRLDIPDMHHYIDRYLGVCHPLLPLLYDLCVIGAQAKSVAVGDDGSSSTLEADFCHQALESLEGLWDRVSAWAPSLPFDSSSRHTSHQISHMLAQALCFQLVAKLLIVEYYASFPWSLSTPTTLLPSSTIAEQVFGVLRATREETGRFTRYVSFPYFCAALTLGCVDGMTTAAPEDTQTYREGLLQELRSYSHGIRTATCEAMQRFAEFAWRVQDGRHKDIAPVQSWIELIELWPTFTIAL